jgi:hypothetical protein
VIQLITLFDPFSFACLSFSANAWQKGNLHRTAIGDRGIV